MPPSFHPIRPSSPVAPFPLSAVASLAGTYKRVEIPENSRFKAAARTEQEDDDLIGTDSTVSGENNSSFTGEERLQSERREGRGKRRR